MKELFDKFRNIIDILLQDLIRCITPTLPIMIGVGMLKVVLILPGPLAFNILKESSDTYIVLSFVAEAGYYFMPIYVAVASADVFGVDRCLAGFISTYLTHYASDR